MLLSGAVTFFISYGDLCFSMGLKGEMDFQQGKSPIVCRVSSR